jgi:hypothetical protein
MDNIIELFKNTGSYNRNKKFAAHIIFLAVILLFPKLFKGNYAYVIILFVFGIFVTDIFSKESLQDTKDRNKQTLLYLIELDNIIVKHQNTEAKLKHTLNNKVNKLDYMYLDATMIHFLYSIKNLSEYNPREFYKLLIGIDNILKLRGQIEEFYNSNKSYPVNISQMFEDAIYLRTKTVNNVHNFIYSVPKANVMYKYVNDIINRYYVLITRHIDKIQLYYKDHLKQTGFNSQTKIVVYNTTMPLNEHDDLTSPLKQWYN